MKGEVGELSAEQEALVAKYVERYEGMPRLDIDLMRRRVRTLALAIRDSERRAAAKAIRAACGPCEGTGSLAEPSHAPDCGGECRNCPVPVETECEYCGRPIAALESHR